MEAYFKTEKLAVGYQGTVLLSGLEIELGRGSILTLIGPNGSGKSTILKSISRQLKPIAGTVWIGKQELSSCSPKQLARQMAVVLTDRIRPDLMTCKEVVAMGRYPYTGLLGRLMPEDERAVQEALCLVHAAELSEREFSELSDGQKQRILLARALCQEPELLILDEPTAYLDLRYKLELLDLLRSLARQKRLTVLLSLHEMDLAMKVSDQLLCLRDGRVEALGSPEEIFQDNRIEQLYALAEGSYNRLFGSVELSKPVGKPRIFVVAGGGFGIPCYRRLQRSQIPFATGILFANDVDAQVASALSDQVVQTEAFEEMTPEQYERAAAWLLQCEAVLDAGTPIGTKNQWNQRLLDLAKEQTLPVYPAAKLEEWIAGQEQSDRKRRETPCSTVCRGF